MGLDQLENTLDMIVLPNLNECNCSEDWTQKGSNSLNCTLNSMLNIMRRIEKAFKPPLYDLSKHADNYRLRLHLLAISEQSYLQNLLAISHPVLQTLHW